LYKFFKSFVKIIDFDKNQRYNNKYYLYINIINIDILNI